MPKKQYKKPPPKTQRQCIVCEKITIWSYNKGTGHSTCDDCGSWTNKQDFDTAVSAATGFYRYRSTDTLDIAKKLKGD